MATWLITADHIRHVLTVANIIYTTGVCALRNSKLSRNLSQRLLVYLVLFEEISSVPGENAMVSVGESVFYYTFF